MINIETMSGDTNCCTNSVLLARYYIISTDHKKYFKRKTLQQKYLHSIMVRSIIMWQLVRIKKTLETQVLKEKVRCLLAAVVGFYIASVSPNDVRIEQVFKICFFACVATVLVHTQRRRLYNMYHTSKHLYVLLHKQ